MIYEASIIQDWRQWRSVLTRLLWCSTGVPLGVFGILFSSLCLLWAWNRDRYHSSFHFPEKGSTYKTRAQAFVSVRSLIKERCPSLFAPFIPAWWLNSGHLQTFYGVYGDFSKIDKILYERRYLRLSDGGTLGLDFTPLDQATMTDTTPIVVVSHGLTGGSYESYVRAILTPACAPVAEGGLGYRGVVVNYRGCAGVPLTSPKLYTAGTTDDLRAALNYISFLYPKAPLLGVGFSLGAGTTIRYLGQEGEQSRLVAGCALACPWNLLKNNNVLESYWVGRQYSKALGTNLLSLVKRHRSALSLHTSPKVQSVLASTCLLDSATMEVFDHTFTIWAGGDEHPYPFPSFRELYEWASSERFLAGVKVPLLTINATNDPIVQEVPTDIERSGSVAMVMTPSGGHLGWFSFSGRGYLGVERWMTKPVLEWLKAVGEELVHDYTRSVPLIERDGRIWQEGRGELQCWVVDGRTLVVGAEEKSPSLQGLR